MYVSFFQSFSGAYFAKLFDRLCVVCRWSSSLLDNITCWRRPFELPVRDCKFVCGSFLGNQNSPMVSYKSESIGYFINRKGFRNQVSVPLFGV